MSIDKETVKRFAEVFRGRTDAWGAVGGACHHKSVALENYERHLEGKTSLGIYPLLSDDTCWWGAHDYDHEDSETPQALMQALYSLGVNRGVYLERTKSFHWRVWLFLDKPAPAKQVRRILKAAIERAGAPTTIEVFPKQDSLAGLEVGNYVNLPYFPQSRGRMLVEADTLAPIPLDTFLDTLTRFPVDLFDLLDLPAETETRTLTAESGPSRTGWHPCLEAFLSTGAQTDTNRNGSLFTFCKHLRALDLSTPAVEQLALSVNGRQDKPLEESEVQRIVSSAMNGKGGAGYTSLGCEDPLWFPYYCNPELRARCHAGPLSTEPGVIAQGANFSITGCVMQRSRPPIFTITVNSVDVSLNREQLMRLQSFRAIVGPEIKRYPLLAKKVAWETLLDQIFQGMTVVEAPEDASESSAVLELIDRYLYNASYAEDVEEMYNTGRPYLDEGGIVFTSSGLSRYLKRAEIEITRPQLWHLVRALGGEQTHRKQAQRQYRCWLIPQTVEETANAD